MKRKEAGKPSFFLVRRTMSEFNNICKVRTYFNLGCVGCVFSEKCKKTRPVFDVDEKKRKKVEK